MTVLELLAEQGPLHPAEIAARLGKRSASIRAYLARLVQEGVVARLEDGTYTLVAGMPDDEDDGPAPAETDMGGMGLSKDLQAKVDRLRQEVGEALPEVAGICRDRDAFLSWLVDRTWAIREKWQEVKARRIEVERREQELRKREQELERREKEAAELMRQLQLKTTELDHKICTELGMFPLAKQLWFDVIRAGVVSKEEVLTVLRTIKETGLDLVQLARAIREQNLPGVIELARRTKEACDLIAERNKSLTKEITAKQEALARLNQEKERLEGELEARRRELEVAEKAVALNCAVARDVGLYVNYIRQACEAKGAMTVQEVMLTPALVMAGAILEAAASAYGDAEVTLMPGRKHPLPTQVTIREIARSLAPPEAYREQVRCEARTVLRTTAPQKTQGEEVIQR